MGSSRTSWIFKPVSALIRSTVALSSATLVTSMGLSEYFRTECRALIASISSMSLIYTFSGTWQSATHAPTKCPASRPLRRSLLRFGHSRRQAAAKDQPGDRQSSASCRQTAPGSRHPQSPAAGQVRLPGSSSPYNLDNLSTKWTFCHPLLPNSPFFRHWSQLCNILRRSDEEPGRKAT